VLCGAATHVNSALDAGDAAKAAPVAAALASMLRAVGLVARADEGEVPADVAALAAERDEARAAKDWARADQLRDELTADGWVVEDTPTGTAVRRA
jgi:cysteinyl-tRNA synthetase